MTHTAYLSLGSNLGNREEHLRAAIRRLNEVGQVTAVSAFYETQPVEFIDQPWFLNCAVALKTTKTPEQLLQTLLALERDLGRQRFLGREKGPRKIDMDILLFDEAVVDSPSLTIPHPSMHERLFVLKPLEEIAPGVRHPTFKKEIRELLMDLPQGPVVRRMVSKAEG